MARRSEYGLLVSWHSTRSPLPTSAKTIAGRSLDLERSENRNVTRTTAPAEGATKRRPLRGNFSLRGRARSTARSLDLRRTPRVRSRARSDRPAGLRFPVAGLCLANLQRPLRFSGSYRTRLYNMYSTRLSFVLCAVGREQEAAGEPRDASRRYGVGPAAVIRAPLAGLDGPGAPAVLGEQGLRLVGAEAER